MHCMWLHRCNVSEQLASQSRIGRFFVCVSVCAKQLFDEYRWPSEYSAIFCVTSIEIQIIRRKLTNFPIIWDRIADFSVNFIGFLVCVWFIFFIHRIRSLNNVRHRAAWAFEWMASIYPKSFRTMVRLIWSRAKRKRNKIYAQIANALCALASLQIFSSAST